MNLSLFALYPATGPFATSIVVVLAIMSIYSLLIVVTKIAMFTRSARATRKVMPEMSHAIQEEQLEQAILLTESHKESHVARVLGAALAEVKPLLRDRATITSADINSAERAAERQILLTRSELHRGLSALAAVGVTAPLVGLLGTTMGIVNGSGIAEALITTAFGLIVAIPAAWMYYYFTTRLETFTAEMTFTSKELIDYLIKIIGSEFGRAIFTKEFQAQKAEPAVGRSAGRSSRG